MRWWRWWVAHACRSAPTKPNGSSWLIKYEAEETSRYLIASDLSWRDAVPIVQGHTLRWLVEVFIQDWKSHEGWSQLTKQPANEGARHSVILSLLVDHRLCMHPDQQDQLTNNLPAYTVGSPTGTRASGMLGRSHLRPRVVRRYPAGSTQALHSRLARGIGLRPLQAAHDPAPIGTPRTNSCLEVPSA